MDFFLAATYGYASVKKHEGVKLDVEILNKTQLSTHQECIAGCSDFPNCFSINVNQIGVDAVDCELLAGDRFRNASNMTLATGYTHYSINVSKHLFS